MFPFRRNGPKKRGKGGGGGRRHHDNGGGAGRRVPGSASELLATMQPSTKALAQMLAGNTKMSGQLAHARNVLMQANRMVDDRLPDRLPPAAREQFFHQLALLKLTIADAEEAVMSAEAEPEPEARPAPVRDAARLREVALRLATAEPVPAAYLGNSANADAEAMHGHADVSSGYSLGPERPERPAGDDESPSAGSGTGPRRERLRLKPVQRPLAEPDA